MLLPGLVHSRQPAPPKVLVPGRAAWPRPIVRDGPDGSLPSVREAPAQSWRFLGRLTIGLAVVFSLGAGAVVLLQNQRLAQPLPDAPPIDIFAALFDTRPVTVTTTALWQKAPVVMARWEFLASRNIWLRMNFDDWDRLPADLRDAGLQRMLARYGPLIFARQRWPAMSAADWDQVPQPIRAMAFAGMIEDWARRDIVAEAYGVDPYEATQTMKAIAMSESWFDHRASAINRDGSRDLGLAGASAFARELVRRWHADGAIDFSLSEADYFNPWTATRWLVFWFGLMLAEANGDINLAVRGYNCGVSRARAGCGQQYLDGVMRRRAQYFSGPSGSPTWRTLSAFRRGPARSPATRVAAH